MVNRFVRKELIEELHVHPSSITERLSRTKRMRRIALVSEHASPLSALGGNDCGGQNVYVANVARELARAGCAVDVFTRRESLEALPIVEVDDLYRVIHVPAGPCRVLPKEQLLRYMSRFARCLIHFARREAARGSPYDLLHANFFMSGLAALAVKQTLGIPLVMTFHALGKVRRMYQGEADRFPDARFTIEDQLVRCSDRIVAECPQDHKDLQELYAADASRIDIVPCGFDSQELFPLERRCARSMLRWNPGEFTVLQLGRLVPRKGIDDVIRAIGFLRSRMHRDARLYVVGGNSDEPDEARTPEIARLRQVAREGGVEDLVHFVGRRSRDVLRYYYSACDVFVTTPWYEPFGITPVEAMACARPVIGAAVGGIRSTVVDGVTGYLVESRNPPAIAQRILHLMSNPDEAAALGAAGRKRAAQRYTWARVVEKLCETYERAIGAVEVRGPHLEPRPLIARARDLQRVPG